MGQRTAIIIKKNFKDGTSTLTKLHLQWGYGRVMPALLMKDVLAVEFDQDYNRDKKTLKAYFNFKKDVKGHPYYKNKSVSRWLDIFNKEFVKKEFEATDNNNGGMIVEITEFPNVYYTNYDVKVAFVTGYEEDVPHKPFEKFYKAEDYIRLTSYECTDKNFVDSYNALVKSMDIHEIHD